MVFQQNLLEKAYFIAKKSGPAMVRPASSDFWKAPLDNTGLKDHITILTVYKTEIAQGKIEFL